MIKLVSSYFLTLVLKGVLPEMIEVQCCQGSIFKLNPMRKYGSILCIASPGIGDKCYRWARRQRQVVLLAVVREEQRLKGQGQVCSNALSGGCMRLKSLN